MPVEDAPPIPVYQTRNRRSEASESHVTPGSRPALAAAKPEPSLTYGAGREAGREAAKESAHDTAIVVAHTNRAMRLSGASPAAAPSAASPAPAASHDAPAGPSGPALTTSDFMRAAGNPAPAAPATRTAQASTASSGFFASGQSQPDDDETLPRSHGGTLDAGDVDAATIPAIRASAPVTVAGSRAAKPLPSPSVVLVAPLRAEAPVTRPHTEVSPSVTARVEAQPPAPTPAGSRPTVVASGFGPEVDVASSAPASKPWPRRTRAATASVARSTPPPVSSMSLYDRDLTTDAAVRPVILPAVYGRNGRVLLPAPLKGSREVLVHQNTMADADGLERIENEAQLNDMREAGLLVGFPSSAALHVNDELPVSHRAARPWTVRFATETARHFYDRFHQPLIVTSAVRTIDYQLRLERVNGNAAGIDGATASPHLTGQAIDFAKGRMNAAELAWMRAYLLPMMRAGLIDVEEEFQQSCFHISVYRRYLPPDKHAHRFAVKAEARTPRQPADTADDEE